jgi:hypothetical protein
MSAMGEGEPVGELFGGLVGGRPVKRHHRGRNTREAQQLCPPAVTDGDDFYEVRAPADGFFEAMYGHYVRYLNGGGTAEILRFSGRRSSEARREGDVHGVADMKRRRGLPEKKIAVAGSQQLLHVSSTAFPQPARREACCEPTARVQ